jgi:hypothetical protein
MTNFETEILKKSKTTDYKNEWFIFHKESSKTHKSCICGHHVKRITYIYNKETKQVMYVGTTCAKKYGIRQHIKNSVLLAALLESIPVLDNMNLFLTMQTLIQNKYIYFCNKICDYKDEIDYYDVVAPFRRLLNDVCDLVSEYKYDFIVLLKEIQTDVESMNQYTKHMMIDEYNADNESISEILSESSYSIDVVENIVINVVDDSDSDELSAITPSEVSDIMNNDIEYADEDFAKTPSELSVVEEVSVVEDAVVNINKNEVKPVLSLLVEGVLDNAFSTYDNVLCCSRSTHCYCNLIYRMKCHNDDILRTRQRIKDMREEVAVLREGVERLNKGIFEFKQKMSYCDELIKSNTYAKTLINV